MTFSRIRLLIIVAVIAALPAIVFGQAQANTGAIEGIVNDPRLGARHAFAKKLRSHRITADLQS